MHLAVDAFISYSHAVDSALAPVLERGLERLARPWNRLRAVSVFRDQTDLSLTPHLWSTISGALDDAGWFVLLASPAAAASAYVDREVAYFCDAKGTERVLVVLTEGTLVWDDATGDFTTGSTALPPALRGRFADEPLWLDLRWARDVRDLSPNLPRFRTAVAQIAAAIRGVPPDELEGEDVRLHRRARRLARTAAAGLVALTLAAGVAAKLAVDNARRADQRARLATSRQVGLFALDVPAAQVDRAFLLSLAAADLDPDGVERFAPTRVLVGRAARLRSLLHVPSDGGTASLRAVALSADGGRVVATAWRPDGRTDLVTWRVRSTDPATVVPAPAGTDPTALVAVPGGGVVLGAVGGPAVLVRDDGRTVRLGSRLLATDLDARRALVLDPGGRVVVIDLADGTQVGAQVGTTLDGTAAADGAADASDAVSAAARDRRAVVVAGGRLTLVDLVAGRPVAEAAGAEVPRTADVAAVAVATGSTRAVTVSTDGRLLTWRQDGGVLVPAPVVRLPAGLRAVHGLAASPGAERALVVGEGGSAVVDVESRTVGPVERAAAGRLAVDPGGRYAAVGGRRLSVWDLTTGSRTLAVPLPVNASAWSGRCDARAGCRLVTAGESLDVWDPRTGRRVVLADQTNAQAVAVSPDAATVVTVGWGTTAAVWGLGTGGTAGTVLLDGGAPVTVDPTTQRLASTLPGGRVRVDGTRPGAATEIDVDAATHLVLGARATRLLDVGPRGVRVWDAATGARAGLDGACAGDLVAVSPRAHLVALHRSRDGATALCRLDTGALVARARLVGTGGPATVLAVDDEGGLAVAGAGVVERYVRDGAVWRPGIGVDVRLGGVAVEVRSLSVRAGVVAAGLGAVPAVGPASGDTGRVLVWDADAAGTPVQFEVDQADVPAVALLGEGAGLLAVGGRDTAAGPVTVQVWESATRRRIGRGLAGLTGDVVALGDDEIGLLGADSRGRVVRWTLTTAPDDEVCAMVGRSLTREEWATAAGGALAPYPYSPVCPRPARPPVAAGP